MAPLELDGEAVLYHQHLRTVSVLNPTATLVWRKLGPSRDLDTLGAELAELFGADRDDVTRDVVRTVEEFDRQGLVVAG